VQSRYTPDGVSIITGRAELAKEDYATTWQKEEEGKPHAERDRQPKENRREVEQARSARRCAQGDCSQGDRAQVRACAEGDCAQRGCQAQREAVGEVGEAVGEA